MLQRAEIHSSDMGGSRIIIKADMEEANSLSLEGYER
jgi:hypothetical protein